MPRNTIKQAVLHFFQRNGIDRVSIDNSYDTFESIYELIYSIYTE